MLFEDKPLDSSHETEVRGSWYMHTDSECRQKRSFWSTQNISADGPGATHHSDEEPEVGEGKNEIEKPENLGNIVSEVS